jgi:hypothetical protein
MLRGRQGFVPFVLGWVGIVIAMAAILAIVFWLAGSLHA